LSETYQIEASLWIWSTDKAPASWHFCTITGDVAEAIHAEAAIRRIESGRKKGWGAIKVRAEIGESVWETSLFPDKASGGWLLPVKAAVRRAEGLVAGDSVQIGLIVL
jgi:Domain of unknown function (DUF1905)